MVPKIIHQKRFYTLRYSFCLVLEQFRFRIFQTIFWFQIQSLMVLFQYPVVGGIQVRVADVDYRINYSIFNTSSVFFFITKQIQISNTTVNGLVRLSQACILSCWMNFLVQPVGNDVESTVPCLKVYKIKASIKLPNRIIIAVNAFIEYEYFYLVLSYLFSYLSRLRLTNNGIYICRRINQQLPIHLNKVANKHKPIRSNLNRFFFVNSLCD